jgi:hypothetical protein
MDFEKVRRWRYDRGRGPHVVLASDFDALLSELRETQRALEIAADEADGRSDAKTMERWISEARTELSTPPEGITKQ